MNSEEESQMAHILFMITGFSELPKEMSLAEALLQESRIERQMELLKNHHVFIAEYHDKVESLLWACVIISIILFIWTLLLTWYTFKIKNK